MRFARPWANKHIILVYQQLWSGDKDKDKDMTRNAMITTVTPSFLSTRRLVCRLFACTFGVSFDRNMFTPWTQINIDQKGRSPNALFGAPLFSSGFVESVPLQSTFSTWSYSSSSSRIDVTQWYSFQGRLSISISLHSSKNQYERFLEIARISTRCLPCLAECIVDLLHNPSATSCTLE
jgi:hypothetical protein